MGHGPPGLVEQIEMWAGHFPGSDLLKSGVEGGSTDVMVHPKTA